MNWNGDDAFTDNEESATSTSTYYPEKCYIDFS